MTHLRHTHGKFFHNDLHAAFPGWNAFLSKHCDFQSSALVFHLIISMCPNAEKKLNGLLEYNEMDGPVFKIKEDPRITRVGKFIRKTSIDELPQLFNILKGDMSIVGPRPALPREVAQYHAYEKQRLLVTPGLTCYWQIQPNRNDLSFDDWMALDVQYIRDRSFQTDWKIIFKTFGAILGMNGE